jgi:hypothetical protein
MCATLLLTVRGTSAKLASALQNWRKINSMARPSQNPREVPPLEALWRGLTAEDIAVLQSALDYFDGSYNSLMTRLQTLGATKRIYAAVNGTAKAIMGKSRSDVDLWNVEEMDAWGDGYQGTIEAMELYTAINEQLAVLATQRGFSDG